LFAATFRVNFSSSVTVRGARHSPMAGLKEAYLPDYFGGEAVDSKSFQKCFSRGRVIGLCDVRKDDVKFGV